MILRATLTGACLAVAACSPTIAPAPGPVTAVTIATGEVETDVNGNCFAVTAPPTETRIVSTQVEVTPAVRNADGSVATPAVFRNVSGPQTRAAGPGLRFAAVCPPQFTAEFVASLQRALIVRRAFEGPVSGTYDTATRSAVRAFQVADGIDSPLLALETARALGLVAVPRDPA